MKRIPFVETLFGHSRWVTAGSLQYNEEHYGRKKTCRKCHKRYGLTAREEFREYITMRMVMIILSFVTIAWTTHRVIQHLLNG